MWVQVNGRWHYVIKTDPDFIDFHGLMLHETRCGLLKVAQSYATIQTDAIVCGRCRNLMEKDAAK